MKTYTGVNALNTVHECDLAIRMGYNALGNVKPEFREELRERITAIQDRRRRLVATERQIKALRLAR